MDDNLNHTLRKKRALQKVARRLGSCIWYFAWRCTADRNCGGSNRQGCRSWPLKQPGCETFAPRATPLRGNVQSLPDISELASFAPLGPRTLIPGAFFMRGRKDESRGALATDPQTTRNKSGPGVSRWSASLSGAQMISRLTRLERSRDSRRLWRPGRAVPPRPWR